ncbi:DUF485 domain-containing protein [Streptomyces bicolor]|uniref:DUF485 domain-containing protein n=1 Tax=Streptomyces bicolor TaxID=66874 RepID=UPI0007C4FD9C|nr:DUF485 domain-containing protein [Streptomyces bicolor]
MSYEQYFPDPPQDPGPLWHQHPQATAAPGGDLNRLRAAYRRLRRVATLTALGYFTLFLILSAYAPGLMTSGSGDGGLTTGLTLGLCQLPVVLGAIAVYERIARRRVDPLAATIRQHAEDAAETHRAAQGDRIAQPAHTARQGQPGWPGRTGWQRPTNPTGGAW